MARNKFPGTCYQCGKPCGIGAGIPQKSQHGRWRVLHVSCDEAATAATALAPAKRPARDKPKPRRHFIGINPW
jgi:hypothetical protein